MVNSHPPDANTISAMIEGYKAGAKISFLASQHHLTKNQVYHYVRKLCPKEHSARLDAQKQEKRRRLKRLISGHARIIPVL